MFFFVSDPPFFRTIPTDEYADPGENVTLRCDVDSNPMPTIVWISKNKQDMVGRGPRLTLQANQTSVGSYTCIAKTQGFTEITETVSLLMKVS